MTLDAEAKPDKRLGYDRIYSSSLGSGKINGMFFFVKKDGTTRFLIHHGTVLYTQTGSDQPVGIYALMANNRSVFFAFNDYVWIMDGTNYLRYDGTSVVTVSSIAYVPTVLVSTPPAGGGTALEDFNLLGSGFKQSFSGNGTAKDFQLALNTLDATPPVTAVVNGTTITEGSGLTVNRSTGVVTFTTSPTNGTNNVVITAYKTVSGKSDTINKVTNYVIFGGTQDTRVFWYGNPNFPANVYRSGLYDPSYAPENGLIKVGSDASKVVNMIAQYDSCIIVKGNLQNAQATTQNVYDVLIWQLRYELSASGSVSFPVLPLNNQIDSIAKDSMQLIDNTPTWLTSRGVYQLSGTNVKDERNTMHISAKIDRSADGVLVGLLDNTNLVNSVSIDYDKKYILAIQDSANTAFVFDYVLGIWLKWDNIKASCFLEINDYLYFGDNTQGLVYRFKKITEALPFNDDGSAINGYIKTKLMNFDTLRYLKTAPRLWLHLKPADISSADLYYTTDQFDTVGLGLFNTEYTNIFDYSLWDYSNFTYNLTSIPSTQMFKIKAKKFMYLQITLRNPRVNESMQVLGLHIYAQMVKEAK
ncbi:hypothetical protein [Paenibacillus sp. NEAU-GSW1]|uniref:hypothetical protein n=1 Tax=Paenibacillus sp. NEAU-GSW1 TaxID=2682486 RepID=UPI001C12C220|nr:hypothetical protein [Paenibacillus sp. NEAU-GSW1]